MNLNKNESCNCWYTDYESFSKYVNEWINNNEIPELYLELILDLLKKKILNIKDFFRINFNFLK